MPFPYAAILKQAYHLTRSDYQAWVFGFFASCASSLHFFLLNIVLAARELAISSLRDLLHKLGDYFTSPALPTNLLALFFILFISAICKGSLIWYAQKLLVREPVIAKSALTAGSKFAFRVLVLRMLIFGFLLLVLGVLVTPVVYLASQSEIGRTVALGILGLGILLPILILLWLSWLVGPVVTVLYNLSVRSALVLSFQLAKTKLKESLMMAGLLTGIWIAFILGLVFGIIIMGGPVAVLSLLLAKLGLSWAIYPFIFSVSLLSLGVLIILSAGLFIFNNFAWTLAVMEMVKTEQHGELAEVLAPEAPVA